MKHSAQRRYLMEEKEDGRQDAGYQPLKNFTGEVRYVTRPLCFVCNEPIGSREGVYICGNIYMVTDDHESRPGILGSAKVDLEEHAFHHKCLYQFTGDAAYDGDEPDSRSPAASPSDWVRTSDGAPFWDEYEAAKESADGQS